ncbi:MAG: response regulator [Myxococcales bacterium]|nr:response regulator [Myxococcales bacterium]
MRTRRRVLIVDDDQATVVALWRTLYQDNERYDVLVAASAEIAQRILMENDVDVMVTDVRLPGRSGIELLRWAADESPGTRVIVMTGYDLDEVRDTAFRHGCLEIVAKPFELDAMHELVVETLERRDSLTGTLDTMAPSDVIQMLCLTQRSTAVRVVDGPMMGVLHIERGEIVHARCDGRTGEAAVYRILASKHGRFDTLPLPKDGPRSVHAPWQHLLLEGARLHDEAYAGVTRVSWLPDASALAGEIARVAVPRSVIAPRDDAGSAGPELESPTGDASGGSATEVAELVDRGFEALRRRDYDAARAIWQRALALDPGNRALELNLRRLERLHTG